MISNQKDKAYFSFPLTKSKHIFCSSCKYSFQLKDYFKLRSQFVPLLLHCGHAICQQCAKKESEKICKVCGTKYHCDSLSGKDNLLPVHVYLVGLLNAIYTRPCIINEPEVSFYQPFESKLVQKFNKEKCYECSVPSTSKCLQCKILYCDTCYLKIHHKAFQDHQIVDTSGISSFCKEHSVRKEYFCYECDDIICPHCSIIYHTGHKVIPQYERNKLLHDEFHAASIHVTEIFSQVNESIKSLNEHPILPEYINSAECTITQHFTYLHGLLQVAEQKMLNKLYSHKQQLLDNIEDVQKMLNLYQSELQQALMNIRNAEENMHSVNLKDVIHTLNSVKDIPCCLVNKTKNIHTNMKFTYDEHIINNILNHSNIEFFDTKLCYLSRIEDVPTDYEIPELPVNDHLLSFITGSNFSKNFPSQSSLNCTGSETSSVKEDEVVSNAFVITEETELSSSLESGVVQEENNIFVKVLHIDSPSNFYVMEVSKINDFRDMEAELQKYAKKYKSLSEDDVSKNLMYIAKFNESWRRARILQSFINLNKEKMYKVLMVDYGYKSELSIDKIKKIPPQYAILPSVTIHCGLFDIEPVKGQWNVAAIRTMNKILHEPGSICMHVHNVQGTKLIVDLYKASKVENQPFSVRDNLIFLEYGSWVRFEKLKRLNPHTVQKLFHEDLKVQNFNSVKCVYIECPSVIYVQKTCVENQSYLIKLQHQLNIEYNSSSENNELIHVPEIGMLCAAPGLIKHTWCRGKIIGTPGRKMVEVYLVDYGAKRTVRYDSIRRLHPQFMTAKMQAIKIQLKGVKPFPEDNGQYTKLAMNFAISQLYHRDVSLFVFSDLEDNSYSGTIYIDDINFAQLMATQKHALYDESEDVNQEVTTIKSKKIKKAKKNSKAIKNREEKHETSLEFSPVSIPINQDQNNDPYSVEIKIIKAESPDSIYVSEASKENDYFQMLEEMKTFYVNKCCIMEEQFKKGDVCVFYSLKDKYFMRAMVDEILSESHAMVYLYDLAVTEEVLFEDLQPLSPEFARLPFRAFKVKLAGILPCGGTKVWPSTTCEKLNEIINENANCTFYITKIGNTEDDNSILVDLSIKIKITDGPLSPTRTEIISVNRTLLDEGVALPVKGSLEKLKKTLAVELKKELIRHLPYLYDNYYDEKFENKYSNSIKVNDLISVNNSDNTKGKGNSLMDIPLPLEDANWKPADIIEMDTFKAVPTYVDYSYNVFVHPVENNTILNYIRETLNNWYENATMESCDRNWREGEMCVVKFAQDNMWYRGTVLKKLNNNFYQVQFVDYGNTEDCCIDSLKKRVILTNIPVQATKCEVEGLVQQSKWSIRELDKMHFLLVEKICTVTCLQKKKDSLLISLFLEEYKQDLIEYFVENLKQNVQTCHQTENDYSLLSENYSEDDTLDDSHLNILDDSDVIIEEIKDVSVLSQSNSNSFSNEDLSNFLSDTSSSNKISEYFVSPFPEINFEEDLDTDILELEMTSLISTTHFWSHLKENKHSPIFNKYHKNYTTMMDEMQKICKYQPVIENVKIGLPCCATFEDGIWYRCEILDYVSDDKDKKDKVIVRYVDFGNQCIKSVNTLYQLDDNWLKLPAMGIICKIWNIECNAKEQLKINLVGRKLQELFENRSVFAKIKDQNQNFAEVELYTDINCINLLYASLINEGLYKIGIINI